MKVELENILDIGTELYSLDENFKIKRKVVVNIRSVFELWGINRNPEQYRWSPSSKVFANLYIDDAALGIPLIEPEDERDYVDWNAVRNLLIARNII